ncbi:MAG: agmatine deiminase family protein, partial [Planctomycetota bacterium]
MKHVLAITLIVTLAACCTAQDPAKGPSSVADRSNEEPVSLPKYMTPQERLLPLPIPVRDGRVPPSGTVHCAAEYERCDGLFFAWEGYTSTITSMIVPMTTLDPEAMAYVVVDTASEQSSAYSTLNSAGADMSQVEFIIRTTDTVWIRDYGPRYIFEDGVRAIIDHTYNRPRPNDNLLNDYISSLWGEPQYDIPLTHGGGNFHLFTNGDAFMSTLILTENPGLSEQDVKDLFSDYQNVDLTIYPGFPTSFDSTQHIDMWMMPVGDDKIIIGQYAASSGQPYTITENAVTDLLARGYTVYRTPGWNSGGTHYTYTNAVIFNDLIFVPQFNHANDTTAMTVFQNALPDYTAIPVDCSSIIGAAGAIHCIVMHVPAYELGPEPTVILQVPNGGEIWTIGEQYDIEWFANDDVAVTSIDILLSTDGGATYPHEIATGLANTGAYNWEVPALASEQCRVKVIAYDGDSNTGTDFSEADFTITVNGPRVIYEFNMDTNPGWTTEGLWAYGVPTGGGGQYGGPDPTSGYTRDFVYGYNLNGDYENNLPMTNLTSTALDCTGLSQVTFSFWRWLGVEQPSYDHAYLSVSTNGTAFTTLWANTSEVADSSWVYQEYDISAIADGQETIYLRWTMGPTDYTWQFCGWNIDDVRITAIQEYMLGDMNCDHDVNSYDIDPFIVAIAGQEAYEAIYDCHWLNGDMNGDNDVNAYDIDAFIAAVGG